MAGISDLQPWLQGPARWLLMYAAAVGCQPTSFKRSYYDQLKLYIAFLRGESRYPAAFPGTSAHEVGRAFDLAGAPEALIWLGGLWKWIGGKWDASDPIHFEA